MQDLVFRLEARQLGRMRNLALLSLALTVLAAVGAGRIWWLPGIFFLGFGWNYLAQRNAYTRIDASGIDAKVFTGLARRAAWADIEDIRVRLRGNNEAVLVVLRSGQAVLDGGAVPVAAVPRPGLRRKVRTDRRGLAGAFGGLRPGPAQPSQPSPANRREESESRPAPR